MAARNRTAINERARDAIKTTQLIKRLQQYALGEKGDQGETIKMDATKLRAAEILLRKTLPDLSNVQHSNDPDNPIAHPSVIRLVGPDGSAD